MARAQLSFIFIVPVVICCKSYQIVSYEKVKTIENKLSILSQAMNCHDSPSLLFTDTIPNRHFDRKIADYIIALRRIT